MGRVIFNEKMLADLAVYVEHELTQRGFAPDGDPLVERNGSKVSPKLIRTALFAGSQGTVEYSLCGNSELSGVGLDWKIYPPLAPPGTLPTVDDGSQRGNIDDPAQEIRAILRERFVPSLTNYLSK